MTGRIIKIISILIISVMCIPMTTALGAEIPAWVETVEGGPRPAPNKAATAAAEEKAAKAELEKWREQKRTTKVPILLYHHITTDKFTNEESVSLISPSDFRLHMTAIKVHFNPISLRKYYEYVMCDDGSVTLPENPIVVTFDDGYLSNYEIAYPILKSLEIPATIFVVTDTVGAVAGEGKVNNTHCTWEQAREMEASGLIEIQSHTVNHLRLTALDYNEQIRQIRKSKYDVEKNMGHACDMIAYPYGDYNEDIKALSRAAGYKMQLLVDDKTTEDDYDVNIPSEGTDNVTRMTIAGNMGNVNVIEIIRRTINKKIIP